MIRTVTQRIQRVVRAKRFEANLAHGEGEAAVGVGRRLGKSPTTIEQQAQERVAALIDAGDYAAAWRLVDFFGFETEERW